MANELHLSTDGGKSCDQCGLFNPPRWTADQNKVWAGAIDRCTIAGDMGEETSDRLTALLHGARDALRGGDAKRAMELLEQAVAQWDMANR